MGDDFSNLPRAYRRVFIKYEADVFDGGVVAAYARIELVVNLEAPVSQVARYRGVIGHAAEGAKEARVVGFDAVGRCLQSAAGKFGGKQAAEYRLGRVESLGKGGAVKPARLRRGEAEGTHGLFFTEAHQFGGGGKRDKNRRHRVVETAGGKGL